MSVSLTNRMVYLRRRNEDLLAQLESNSIILEERLKKLRETARTPRRSDKSWSKLPQSHLKRKYQSWKKRNNSCQVSAAFNPLVFQDKSEESSSSEINGRIEICVEEPALMSPGKRTKRATSKPEVRRVTISSRGKSPTKPCCKEVQKKTAPFKTSNSDCYCTTSGAQDRRLRRDKIVPDHLLDDVDISSDDSISNLDSQRKTLEEARSVLSYSPESVFLRRLKKHSQINLNEATSSRPKPASPKCPHRKKVVPKENCYKETNFETPPAENTRSKHSPNRHKDAATKQPSCRCRLEPAGYDTLAGLQDNSEKVCRLTNEGEEWVDKLSEFRRSHWFDCHAFPASHADSRESLLEDHLFDGPSHGNTDKDGHKCIHRYYLNDRLFPVPLYSDNEARSRCLSCHLPSHCDTRPSQRTRAQEKIPITLPKRPPHELHQSQPTVAGFKIVGGQAEKVAEKKHRPCALRHPILARQPSLRTLKPSNSLALRYQKGMI